MSKINYTPEDLVDHNAVAAIIKDKNGNILMQDHVKFGFWTIPIGKAHPNQSPRTAIKQEIFEECNLHLKKFQKIGTKKYYYVRDGKDVHLTLHLYEIFSYSGDLENKEPHKHRQQKFLPLEKIKTLQYLSDATIFYLEKIGYKRPAKL